jgi:hypothetical protein
MTRRRRRRHDSSLELLLDTICNSFGGVLFLAILIAVLLQMNGGRDRPVETPQPTEAEQIALHGALVELSAELESLRKARQQQEELITELDIPDAAGPFEALSQLRAQRDARLALRLNLLRELVEGRSRIQQLNEDLRQLDEALAAARYSAEQQQRRLEAEVAARARTARLPQMRSTSKREIAFAVRYGRLYQVLRYDGVDSAGPNSDEMDDVTRLGSRGVVPKPGAGMPIAANAAFAEQLRRRVATFSPSRCYLCIALWPDSFNEFQIVKTQLVALGYEYRLLLMRDREPLTFGPAVDRRVQ